MARLGRVPKTADTFEWGGMKFEVIDMDGRRIDKVLVAKNPGAHTVSGGISNSSGGRLLSGGHFLSGGHSLSWVLAG